MIRTATPPTAIPTTAPIERCAFFGTDVIPEDPPLDGDPSPELPPVAVAWLPELVGVVAADPAPALVVAAALVVLPALAADVIGAPPT